MHIFLIVCAIIFALTDAGPIVDVGEEISFEDPWKLNVVPHSMPFLKLIERNHILPITSKDDRIVKEKPKKTEARMAKKLGDAVTSKISCSMCRLGVGVFANEIKKGTPYEDIRTKFISLCVTFKIQNEMVCTGIFDTYGPIVVPAFKATKATIPQLCQLVLGEICGADEIPLHEWKIEFPDTSKPTSPRMDLPKAGLPVFKVLQISDTHYDPEYEEGSPANCKEPLCCRSYSTPPNKETVIRAGKWGSYESCDSPKIVLDNMLKHISETHPDIDYIIWTGDLPPHDVWNQTKDGNLAILREAVQQMFDYFPNTPIFPALGNHEAIPAGNFAPPWMKHDNQTVAWLYSEAADSWRRWLPPSSGNTLIHGGFYSLLLRPGFRLISINSNFCHTFNWWLLVNSTDPGKELHWLVHELHEAEKNNEKVHIIGHIPPGSSDCMKVWSRNFYAIIDRFENTITGQFYGHSHADEFEVFYETTEFSKKLTKFQRKKLWQKQLKSKENVTFPGRATNIAYMGPSVTTYDNFNPAYRIYYIDGDHNDTTREVLDHETWTFNLNEANSGPGTPNWYKLYSAKDAYSMPSLRPIEWAKLIERMVDDPDLFEEFYKNYYRDSIARPSCSDSKCKLHILCDLKSARSHDRHHLCHDLEVEFGV